MLVSLLAPRSALCAGEAGAAGPGVNERDLGGAEQDCQMLPSAAGKPRRREAAR